MLDVGGVLAFDDIGYPPVQKVGLGLGLGLGLPTRVPRPPTLSPCFYPNPTPSQLALAAVQQSAPGSSPDLTLRTPTPTKPLLKPW